jgi:hypothetical protein
MTFLTSKAKCDIFSIFPRFLKIIRPPPINLLLYITDIRVTENSQRLSICNLRTCKILEKQLDKINNAVI